MRPLVLGVDIGTSSTKAVLTGADGKVAEAAAFSDGKFLISSIGLQASMCWIINR
ncbi:MAG: hypothetical protein NVSMB49_02530 [Ktedonobacteraceae bacterium]